MLSVHATLEQLHQIDSRGNPTCKYGFMSWSLVCCALAIIIPRRHSSFQKGLHRMTPNEDFAESVYQTNFSEYVLWTAYSRPPRPTSGTQATLDMQLCASYLSPPCARSA